jgi:hypothetical protein
MPIRRPIAKVTPAAPSPSKSWRPPERQTGTPVKIVIAAPIANSATPLSARLARIAALTRASMNGKIGIIAPSANRKNDATAASRAEPPSSCGSRPSSSRASATLGFVLGHAQADKTAGNAASRRSHTRSGQRRHNRSRRDEGPHPGMAKAPIPSSPSPVQLLGTSAVTFRCFIVGSAIALAAATTPHAPSIAAYIASRMFERNIY